LAFKYLLKAIALCDVTGRESRETRAHWNHHPTIELAWSHTYNVLCSSLRIQFLFLFLCARFSGRKIRRNRSV